MNYVKIYNEIVERGLNRVLENGKYYEIHHIIPKCMGGDENVTNKVKLTFREHFICHWLLTRMYDESKLVFAFNIMAYGFKNRYKDNSLSYVPSSRILEEKRIIRNKGNNPKEIKTIIKRKTSRERSLEQYLKHCELKNTHQ